MSLFIFSTIFFAQDVTCVKGQEKAYVFSGDSYEYKEISSSKIKSAVQIYFLGGCGYLISGGGKNILIDALYKHPHPKYAMVRTPDEAYKKMLNLEHPFQKIDLLLVSHPHSDHFTTNMAFPFLLRHKETRMIANEYTISVVKENDPENYEQVKNQIRSHTPDWGKVKEITENGCKIKLYLVKHTTDVSQNKAFIVTQFLLEIAGLRILHMGDMYLPPNMEYFDHFGFENENIDIVFCDNWNYEEGKILMNEYIKPKLFIAMHNRINEEGRYYQSILKSFPNTIIFTGPMEKKIFLKSIN